MRRKRNLIISASCVLAFFLALTGCSKGDSVVEQQPVNVEENNEIVQPIEEQSEQQVEEQAEPQIKTGFTGELATKKNIAYVPLTATMQYTGDTTIAMSGSDDNAELVNLNASLFSVYYHKNSGSGTKQLNQDGTIRLHSASNRNGSSIDVEIESGYEITSVALSYKTGADKTEPYVTVAGVEAVLESGSYIIDSNTFNIQNIYQGSTDDYRQVHLNSVTITYEEAAQEVVESSETSSSLSFNYVKTGDGVINSLNRANTYLASAEAGSGYKNWENVMTSGITYVGKNGGDNGSIQLNSTSPAGIVTTANLNNREAKKITVVWDSHTSSGRSVTIYGKNTEYSTGADLYGDNAGTSIGTLSFNNKDENNETSLIINDSYKYLGIKASGALYIASINIQWGDLPVYSYSNVAIRFGGFIKKSLWNRTETELDIKGYGVMLSTAEYLSGNTIKNWYASNSLNEVSAEGLNAAITTACGENVGAVKNFYTSLTESKFNPDQATDVQKENIVGTTSRDYYIWNLYKNISTSPDNRNTNYTAVAYIRVETGIVFLDETTASAKSIANDLINSDAYDEDSFDGSLNDLANLA